MLSLEALRGKAVSFIPWLLAPSSIFKAGSKASSTLPLRLLLCCPVSFPDSDPPIPFVLSTLGYSIGPTCTIQDGTSSHNFNLITSAKSLYCVRQQISRFQGLVCGHLSTFYHGFLFLSSCAQMTPDLASQLVCPCGMPQHSLELFFTFWHSEILWPGPGMRPFSQAPRTPLLGNGVRDYKQGSKCASAP